MFKWIHQLLNPHCPHCKEEKDIEREESHHCDSCEILKAQLTLKNHECAQLLSRILKEPEPVVQVEPIETTGINKSIPWRTRQQLLEKEDRAKAAAMKNAATPDSKLNKVDTAELEKELGVVEQTRETTVSGSINA